MRVGVPSEIKNHEYRVGLVPSSVAELTHHGHEVLVQAGAGLGSGIPDADYSAAGGTIVSDADTIFAQADLVVKVKEPLPAERKMLRPGQILFTYLHLAPDAAQTQDLVASGATCIAYETVTSPTGGLPLLTPMSEVAGASLRRSARIAWRRQPAAGASCWAAFPAFRRRKSSSSVAASRAPMRRRSRSAWART